MAEKGNQRKRSRKSRSDDKQGQKIRAHKFKSPTEPSSCHEPLDELQHLVAHTFPRKGFVDSDETQPPSSESQGFSDDSNLEISNANSEGQPKNQKGRGKAKCLYVDMNTGSGRKIQVQIPEKIGRAIGKHARNIVNFCGLVVRGESKLSYKNWPTVKKEVGDIMLAKVKDKFEMDRVNDQLFNTFIFSTMRRLYRVWKCRLHNQWSKLSENDRAKFIPKEVGDDDWSEITKYWESDEFQRVSKRNKKNREKNTTKHTCGSAAFVEIEENLKNTSCEPLTVDEVWLHQHTRKNSNGELEWCDPTSEESYYKLKECATKQVNGDIRSMTNDEMLLEVLGKKSGYFRGKGAGVKPPSSKGTLQSVDVEKIREELRGEMQSNIENIVEQKLEEERAKLTEEWAKLAEERAKIIEEERAKNDEEFKQNMDKAIAEKMNALIAGSQLSQLILPVDTPAFMKNVS